MMIEMGDPKKRGYIEIDDFLVLMKEIGLISEPVVEIVNNEKQEQRKKELERA